MSSSCARRPLQEGAEERIAAAGVKSWPVEIYVNPSTAPRFRNSTGVVTLHHRTEGTEVALNVVGKTKPPVEDIVCIDGVAPGLATQILHGTAGRVLRVVA